MKNFTSRVLCGVASEDCLENSAAGRELADVNKTEHVMPAWKQLHWFPISFEAQLKMLVSTFKTLNGSGLEFLKAYHVLLLGH